MSSCFETNGQRLISNTNFGLKLVQAILTYEKNKQSALFGSSIFGIHEFHQLLLGYKSKMGKSPGNFYIVKADVTAAFDNILPDKLLGLVKDLLSQEPYILRRYINFYHARGKWRYSLKSEASLLSDFKQFPSYCQDILSMMHQNRVFINQNSEQLKFTAKILELLEDHLSRQYVKYNNKVYYLTNGIPQGSVVSALLCRQFFHPPIIMISVYTLE